MDDPPEADLDKDNIVQGYVPQKWSWTYQTMAVFRGVDKQKKKQKTYSRVCFMKLRHNNQQGKIPRGDRRVICEVCFVEGIIFARQVDLRRRGRGKTGVVGRSCRLISNLTGLTRPYLES